MPAERSWVLHAFRFDVESAREVRPTDLQVSFAAAAVGCFTGQTEGGNVRLIPWPFRHYVLLRHEIEPHKRGSLVCLQLGAQQLITEDSGSEPSDQLPKHAPQDLGAPERASDHATHRVA